MKALYLLVLAAFLICPIHSYASMREPAVSGSFYSDDKNVLREDIEGYINNAKIEKGELPKGELIGFISPHAGYPYSGPVAGYDYKLLQGKKYDTVIILGVNHTVRGFNDVSVWNEGAFKTPLGDVPIDVELANAIIKENPKKFYHYPKAHKREHSIEVQVPFLQVALDDFKIVPIVVADYSSDACKELAEAIVKSIKDKNVLIIASTDLSHDKPYDVAVSKDNACIKDILDSDTEKLAGDWKNGKIEACGYGPVLTFSNILNTYDNVKGVLLKYANSGDITKNKYGRIVGYAAVAFYKVGDNMKEGIYTQEEKKALLELARNSINDYLNGVEKDYPVFSEKFNENRGVFVTLHKNGMLRGCIGYIKPIQKLQQAVINNAVNAAVKDGRFPKVSLKEMDDIDIEISVLTPPQEISGPEEFMPGEHGIIINKVFYSAVFLPQVAPEQGWDREETLSNLCRKAGLPRDEWKKDGMVFSVFTAEVFGEKEIDNSK